LDDLNFTKSFKLDIRLKLIITILLIVFIVSTSKGNYLILLMYFAIVLVAVFLFKPLLFLFFKRMFLVFLFPLSISIFIPFVNKGSILYEIKFYFFTLHITDNGVTVFFTTLIKTFLSVMVITALVVSSSDLELLNGLRKMYFPKIMVTIIFLMYRYLFLIRDEARVGQRAINSRVFQKSYYSVNKRLAFLAGSLFIKSFDRAENIYKSMESRGFVDDFPIVGEIEKISASNFIAIALIVVALALIKYLEVAKIL
jgi:cobalt/nickel transport system permease protein